ncbi:MAG: hypothetical protein ACLTQR_03750 [Methanobrevibacter smithii]
MMTQHNNFCYNEDRIITLETKANHRQQELNEFKKKMGKLDSNLDKLCINVAEVNSILSTLKWILGLSIALFGGIFCFLVTELIKLL